MKNLILVPGLSSPFHESHKMAYDSLFDEAKKREYLPKVVCLPGQANEYGEINNVYSPECCVEELTKILINLENTEQKYRLVGFSCGCAVVMSTLARLPSLTRLDYVVLWGAIPFWLQWKVFILGKERNSVGNGTSVIQPESEFFSQLEPVEYLIPLINYPMTLALGADDPYISDSYIEYLRSIAAHQQKKNYSFAIVEGCRHTVRVSECENWQGYLSTIF